MSNTDGPVLGQAAKVASGIRLRGVGDNAATTADDWTWLGSPSASVRVGGHSHLRALRSALPHLDDVTASQVALLDTADGQGTPDDDYWRLLGESPGTTAVIWEGNQHNVSFLLGALPIAIVGRSARAPVAAAPGTVVPWRMAQELWRPSLEGLVAFLAAHPTPGSVIVVGTPPPKSEEHVRAGLMAEPLFVLMLEREGLTPDTVPVVGVETRVAAWESLQESMAQIADAHGARFLEVPDMAREPWGTLLPEYCAADASHANPDYGLLMWHHLMNAI
jgi:hypothetical protein